MNSTGSRKRKGTPAFVYRILDSVLETAEAVEVVRKGRVRRIVADTPSSRLAGLKKRDCIKVNPDDIVEIDMQYSWTRLTG